MSGSTFARRRFLQAVGGLSVASPFFSMLERSALGATPYPLRLLTVFNPHGTWLPMWRPQGGENDFTFKFADSMLEALEPYKKKLLVIDGLDHRIAYESGGIGHGAARAAFTGARGIDGTEDTSGPSIEQYLADRYGKDQAHRSLQLSVGWEKSMSFNGAGKQLPGENRPSEAYKRVFSAGVTETPVDDTKTRRELARKLGIVNALKAEVDALKLQKRLGIDERTKLDEHLNALADMEKRMNAAGGGAVKGCKAPTAPGAIGNPNDPAGIPQASRAMIDILVQSFACDLTRFVGFSYHGPGAEAPMPYANVNKNTHLDVAHTVSNENVGSQQDMLKLHRWYAGEFAYLLQQLDSIKEGDETLLDHTMIVWSSELGNPAVHDHFNVPFIVAGGTNKRFKMGRYLRFNPSGGYDCNSVNPRPADCSGENRFAHLDPHNRLLTAICQAFGENVNFFNAPAYTGVLPNVLA